MKGYGAIGTTARAAAAAGLTVLLGLGLAQAGESPSGPPADFRSWAHAKSMVVVDRNSGLFGFHNVYANEIALPTLKAGGRYREGAALAVAIHELETKEGGTVQGKRIKVGFMKKEGTAEATGGWRYTLYGPDGKAKDIDPVKACHECHAKAKDADCVFSKYVE